MNQEEALKLISMAQDSGYLEDVIEMGNGVELIFHNGESLSLDFTEAFEDALLKKMTELYPVIGVIRLIREAIDLGIVTDVSENHKKISMESYGDSIVDIMKSDVFFFRINSESFEDVTYKITFDRKKHNIRTHTEYASRTSQFVDTLIKRVMAKYNVLLVQKASWYTKELPTLPLEENAYVVDTKISDSEGETDTIQNQLKVLVHYRDNFNSTTCTENVIDDIFISIKGGEISYGFLSIGQSEAEPIYDVINESVSIDDVDSLLRIRSMIQEPSVKFKIFETLRGNKDTNLSKLVESRILEYDTELNSDPKIEFTITPLSIYCNHIVEKSCTFVLKSKNPLYESYEVEYNVTYNPADVAHTSFLADAEGDSEIISPQDKLVLAFTDVPSEDRQMNIRVTTTKYATMLYGKTTRYMSDVYKDVYFSNEALVKLSEGKILPFDGVIDDNTYLRSQVVRGEITGRYLYINEAEALRAVDILGMELFCDEEEIRYVSKTFVHHCDICGHAYGSSEEVWRLYHDSHRVVNLEGDTACCDFCVDNPEGIKERVRNKVILYSEGSSVYYLENENKPTFSGRCICCEDAKKGILFISPSHGHLPEQCKSCGRYFCKSHMEPTGICHICNHNVDSKKLSTLPKKLVRTIKTYLALPELTKKGEPQCYYLKDENALWIYTDKKKSKSVYYFTVDEETGFCNPEGKHVEKR